MRLYMADNHSLVGGEPLQKQINDKVIIVQILVMIFLCINFLLIVTFLKKESLQTIQYMLCWDIHFVQMAGSH